MSFAWWKIALNAIMSFRLFEPLKRGRDPNCFCRFCAIRKKCRHLRKGIQTSAWWSAFSSERVDLSFLLQMFIATIYLRMPWMHVWFWLFCPSSFWPLISTVGRSESPKLFRRKVSKAALSFAFCFLRRTKCQFAWTEQNSQRVDRFKIVNLSILP